MTTIGREGFVDPQLRVEYINLHPEGNFNSHIYKGEIKRGMKSDEVVASWGFPNVLLVDDHYMNQHWVYYTRGSDNGSVLIYTLDFLDSNLQDWDIDIKRFTNFSLDDDTVILGGRDRVSISSNQKRK
jgi:hypothetical protein